MNKFLIFVLVLVGMLLFATKDNVEKKEALQVSLKPVIPVSVINGEELPTTLEMCHSLYIDANDAIYNKDLEIKQLQQELEELKEQHAGVIK